ncbi:MAG: hypothetical protein V4544_02245 [Pseudomonadota bacterium]
MSLIIFLNGCGSSGKTSIAHSLQHLSPNALLHFSMDMLIDMLPTQYIAGGEKVHEGYFSFVPSQNENGPLINIKEGALGERVFGKAPTIAKTLADQGNDMIIDEVLFGDSVLRTYVDQLKEHTVYFIGIFCDLKQMQEREILRRDRALGLANGQINRVHDGIREYDIKIDTTNVSPFQAANYVLQSINKMSNPQGFKKMGFFFV